MERDELLRRAEDLSARCDRMKKILRGGTVINASGRQKADVLIEDEKIAAVAPELNCAVLKLLKGSIRAAAECCLRRGFEGFDGSRFQR